MKRALRPSVCEGWVSGAAVSASFLFWLSLFLARLGFGTCLYESVYLILRDFPGFRDFDRPAPPEKKLKKKNWKKKKKLCLRKIPENPSNKDGKVPAFLPKPVQINTIESNSVQNMTGPYCREREKKSKRKLIFALAKKRESWVTLLCMTMLKYTVCLLYSLMIQNKDG